MTRKNRFLVFNVLPLFGGTLALIGDFLLGWLEPGAMGTFGMAQVGWADVALWRPALSMFFASIAFPLYLVGLYGIYGQILPVSARTARTFLTSSALASVCGLFVHAFFCLPQYAYKFLYDTGHPDLALRLTNGMYGMLAPTIAVCLALPAAALLILFVAIIRKRTPYARWCALANPLAIAFVTVPVALLFPDSAFLYGLCLSTPNLGFLSLFAVAAVHAHGRDQSALEGV